MNDKNTWWNTLRHEGVLISPVVMDDWLKEGPIHVEDRAVDKLRQAYYRFADDPKRLREFLDAALQDFLGHAQAGVWRKEQDIPDRFKHQGKKPNRVLLNAGKEHQPRFLVLIDDEHVVDDQGNPRRLGLHSGRRKHADLLRLMRAADVKLGLFTNGHHFRLIYAGMDHESWAEWSTDAWFQGGDGRLALHGFFTLLGTKTLPVDTESDKNLLLAKIQESRDRQADLSHVMGTQIREAVEILLEELTDTLASHPNATDILAPLRNLKRSRDEELQALYQAAIRCIMRLVVQLYAESRALLPKQERLYYESYSIEGLYQILRRAVTDGREEELRALRSAWPRLLASWRAIHDGSIHKDLQIQTYGGQLFKPYAEDPKDPVLAALAVLGDPRVHVSDWAIHDVLQKLRVGKFKIGRGKWRPGPVDFSDLRTEYIGMMYEGLLDYDLREAREEDGGIVFLAIGDQPALPLKVLEAQSDTDLKTMLKEQGKKGKSKGADEDSSEEEDETGDEEASEEGEEEQQAEDEVEQTAQEAFQGRVMAWATRAVELGGLFGATPAKLKKLDVPEQKKLLQSAARQLILKSIPPGGMYLVRWSGTRKGSGTFYTKPGLAVPTTVRTLEPLVYDNHEDREHRIVKRPEEILALKVCDPAMGSGSFLVAALRFLSHALKESFEKYILPEVDAGKRKVTETGETAVGFLTERILRNRHEDHSGERMESALKRAVVEHCIYGVDLNPLAVELGKLSLWIETMDPTLRFTFLDHKIKCGNSLIGAWRHQAHIYPLAAWDRDFGDGPKNPRTKRAKLIRKQVILPELKVWLDGWKLEAAPKKAKAAKVQLAAGQRSLFGGSQAALQQPSEPAEEAEDSPGRLVRIATQTTFTPLAESESWESRRQAELQALSKIHTLIDPKEQEEDYRKLVGAQEHQALKYELDKWCSVWFWPIRAEENAPLDTEPILGPKEFYQNKQRPEIQQTVQRLADRHRFFHWELEFPEVFGEDEFGFDAIVGNPPWDNITPDMVAFFTKYDAAFRAASPKEKLGLENRLLAHGPIAEDRRQYLDGFRGIQHFIGASGAPFDSRVPNELAPKWAALSAGGRAPFAFHHQIDRSNLFKAFAELSFGLLARSSGRFGLILPEGIYAQESTASLRADFFDKGRLELLLGFENRKRLFPIDSRFKFCVLFVARSGPTQAFNAAFFLHTTDTLQQPEGRVLSFDMRLLRQLSPQALSIPEVGNGNDLQILQAMASRTRRFSEVIAPNEVGREFNVSEDAEIMTTWAELDGKGARINVDGSASISQATYLPVASGIQIFQMDANYQRFNHAEETWDLTSPGEGRLPELWMEHGTFASKGLHFKPARLVYRAIAPSTNQRTMVAAVIPEGPCVHSLMMVKADLTVDALAWYCTVLNSYAFDFVQRMRQAGSNVSWFQLKDAPFAEKAPAPALEAARKILFDPRWFPKDWRGEADFLHAKPAEAHQLREEIDDAVATSYGLTNTDMRWILRPDNPDPRNLWRDYRERLKILEGAGLKGKWYTLEEAREIRRKAGMEADF